MDPSRPTLLLTRPEAASLRFAAEFGAQFGADWPVVISPLMQTAWLSPAMPQTGARDVIFTSETAVEGFTRLCDGGGLHGWCVGARTAAAARAAGFSVTEGPGDANGLARLIAAEKPGAVMLWPRGAEAASDMAVLLDPAGIEIVSLVVYDQQPKPLQAAAVALLAGTAPILLPLFSPRSVRLFSAAAPACACAPLLVAAISASVAAECATLPPARLELAATPDSSAMIAALGRLLAA